jgi:hypothetical protein
MKNSPACHKLIVNDFVFGLRCFIAKVAKQVFIHILFFYMMLVYLYLWVILTSISCENIIMAHCNFLYINIMLIINAELGISNDNYTQPYELRLSTISLKENVDTSSNTLYKFMTKFVAK